MKAIGIGDCTVYTLDNTGRSFKLTLKDALHVPGATKNLMSATCLSQQGFQTVLPCVNGNFTPGLYCPKDKKSSLNPKFIPFETVQGLHYIATWSDGQIDHAPPITYTNQVIVFSRKLGHCPLATLWKTKNCVQGLESIQESHFPRNYVSEDAIIGKMTKANIPSMSSTAAGLKATRPNETYVMDTLGPTKHRSIEGYFYNTSFTCAYSAYAFSYGHASTAQIPELMATFHADSSKCSEKHGDQRVMRCDNASVNVSRRVQSWLKDHAIRLETSCPYESHQNGKAERMNRTLETIARTVLLSSGLDMQWWSKAVMYATYNHNLRYSQTTQSSPFLIMYGEKPDVSFCQEFGCRAWIHVRAEQRKDSKFDARGEPVVFVGYPPNQKGFLLWCPIRGPKTVVSSNNIVFGHDCPYSRRSALEIFSDTKRQLPLQDTPLVLTLSEVRSSSNLHIVDTYKNNYVLADTRLQGFRLLDSIKLSGLISYVQQNDMPTVYLALTDSYALHSLVVSSDVFSQEVDVPGNVPKTVKAALMPPFQDEWTPAIDHEIAGFLKHHCFKAVPALPKDATCLPGIWVFSRKSDNTAKARLLYLRTSSDSRFELLSKQKLLCCPVKSRQQNSFGIGCF